VHAGRLAVEAVPREEFSEVVLKSELRSTTPAVTPGNSDTLLDIRAADVSASAPRSGGRLRAVLTVLWVLAAGAALAYAWDYYMLPLPERPFSPKHELLAPTGLFGHWLGIIGSLMMAVGVGVYELRKRVPFMSRAGKLSYWLQVHIFLCTLGPFLILLHTSFRFGGVVSIAFWSMVLVVLSGVFGRFVYVRIPKTIHGQFRTLESIERQRKLLIEMVVRDTGLEAAKIERLLLSQRMPVKQGLLSSITSAVRFELGRKKRERAINRQLDGWRVTPGMRSRVLYLAQREVEIDQQIQLLKPFQRLFRYWHVFHLPLAIVLLLILIVHVTVVTMFGYGWPG
jgi:hypothetical protein